MKCYGLNEKKKRKERSTQLIADKQKTIYVSERKQCLCCYLSERFDRNDKSKLKLHKGNKICI